MKKNIIKTLGQYIKENREFSSHREEGPNIYFFERIPGIRLVDLGIVSSIEDEREIFNEAVRANRARGILTILPR